MEIACRWLQLGADIPLWYWERSIKLIQIFEIKID
jgi:hypothetical protein